MGRRTSLLLYFCTFFQLLEVQTFRCRRIVWSRGQFLCLHLYYDIPTINQTQNCGANSYVFTYTALPMPNDSNGHDEQAQASLCAKFLLDEDTPGVREKMMGALDLLSYLIPQTGMFLISRSRLLVFILRAVYFAL